MYFKQIIGYLFAFIVLVNSARSSDEPRFEDLTIVVNSCDKYSSLWEGFFTLLFKQWPSLKTTNKEVPIILISNKLSYPDPRVKTVHNWPETSWSHTMLDTLKEVKTKYVLILLEDYYINKFDERRLKDIFDLIKSRDIAYIEVAHPDLRYVTGGPYKCEVEGIDKKDQYDNLRTSLQATFWRTEDLKFLIRPGESIWEFEYPGSLRSQGIRSPFLAVVKDYPLTYLNMAYQGYLVAKNVRAAESLGISLKNSNLPLDEDHRIKLWVKQTLPPLIHDNIVLPLKKAVKSIL